jgi:LPS export ABC transporter permease LptG
MATVVRIFSTLDRHIVKQVAGPAALGFVTYTFLLMMRGLFSLVEQIFVRGLPAKDALAVLLATLPHVMVLTIPMGFLFGVLLGVGRMTNDNEIVALQAGGISVRRLLLPIVGLGLVLTIASGYLFTAVIPKGNRSLKDLRIRLFTSAKNLGRIEPQVFYDQFPNLMLYVEQVDPESGAWLNVLAHDSSSPGEERLILARRGRVVSAEAEGVGADTRSGFADDGMATDRQAAEPWIVLEEAVTHQFFRAKPDTYRVNNNQMQMFRPEIKGEGVIRYNLAMRERDTGDLVAFVRGGELEGGADLENEAREAQLRLAELELHRRLAIPSACVVFGLLALPLGVGSRSGGKGRGFVLSIAVILAYYILSNNTELLAIEGSIPAWLGIWLPNISLVLLAIVLMWRMGRWLGERSGDDGLVARGLRGWREWRVRRAVDHHGSEHAVTGSIPVSLQRRRYGGGFPTLLDRYMIRRLLVPLAMVVLSTALLYVVVDLTDRISDIGENDAPLEVVVAYYWNLVPQVIVDVIPFGLLIGVLILLTVLERQQELTALKGAGISLFRMTVPVLLVAIVGAAAMWALGEWIVPSSNRVRERLLDRIKGRATVRSYSGGHRQWLLSRDDSTFYNFLRYDVEQQTLVRFNMYRVDENMELRFILFSHRVRYKNGAWVADSGWYRRIDPDGTDDFHRIQSPLELGIVEGPAYFGQEYRSPSEMNHRELAEYIEELQDSGYRPNGLLVRWHQKLSYPLSAIVMVCLALPFGLNRGGRRVTTMQGIALALGLGIVYAILVAVFGKLGEAAVLPPIIGAWAPVVLGLLFAVNRMTTLRT